MQDWQSHVAFLNNDVKCCNKPSRSHTHWIHSQLSHTIVLKTQLREEEKALDLEPKGTARQQYLLYRGWHCWCTKSSNNERALQLNFMLNELINVYQLSQVESDFFFHYLTAAYILANSSCHGKSLFTLIIPKRLERCRFDPFPGARRPRTIESTCFHSRSPEPRCTMSSSDWVLFSPFIWHVPSSLHRCYIWPWRPT